jgi:hypothetical protein
MLDNETQEIVETPIEQPVQDQMVENQGENAPEMVENQFIESKPASEEPKPVPESSTRESISSKHFKRVNDEKEQLKRQNEELMRLIQEERNRYQPQQPQAEDDFGIDDNNFAEGKDLKRFAKEVRELKQELHQYKQKTVIDVTHARLRAEMPDFDKVVTDENIALFEAEYPDEAEALKNSTAAPLSVGKAVYKNLKRLGIYVEDTSAPSREAVQKNLSKPRPATSVSPRQGSTPLSKVDDFGSEDLTEERAAALRLEIARYKRG